MICNFSTTTTKDTLISLSLWHNQALLQLQNAPYVQSSQGIIAIKKWSASEVSFHLGFSKRHSWRWKEIRCRVYTMSKWTQDLVKWSQVLGFVLNEFVQAKGNPDVDFWNHCHHQRRQQQSWVAQWLDPCIHWIQWWQQILSAWSWWNQENKLLWWTQPKLCPQCHCRCACDHLWQWHR